MTSPRRSIAPLALPLGAVVTVALTVVLVRRSADLLGSVDHLTVDALLALTACVIGAGVGMWLAWSLLVAASCLVARLAGRSWRRGERLVQRWAPRAVRRALVSAVAAGVGISLGGVAQAATLDPASVDLGWTVTTTRSTDTPAPPASVAASTVSDVSHSGETEPGVSGSPSGGLLVRPGDTLWSIAAEHLAPGADDAMIARAWPEWYQANVATIGDDPDLLHPGELLQTPRARSAGADDGAAAASAS